MPIKIIGSKTKTQLSYDQEQEIYRYKGLFKNTLIVHKSERQSQTRGNFGFVGPTFVVINKLNLTVKPIGVSFKRDVIAFVIFEFFETLIINRKGAHLLARLKTHVFFI